MACSRVAMLLKEEEDADGCGGAGDNVCTGHRRSYCNESSCINAISRNEKRKDEAAEDLGTFFTHMRNGAQADESARREAQIDVIDRELGSSSPLGGRCG